MPFMILDLAEPRGVADHPSRRCAGTRRPTAKRDNAAADAERLGVKHETAQICPVGHRARFGRIAGPALAQGKPTVGIAMPTKASARWIDDGNNIVKVLKERGYNTDLQYAEDDIPNQLSQIENMVTKGARCL